MDKENIVRLNEVGLYQWIKDNDLMMDLTIDNCKNIVDTLHTDLQFIYSTENNTGVDRLYRGYMTKEGEKIVETTIDECIDIACELSYEELVKLDEWTQSIPYREPKKYIAAMSEKAKASKVNQSLGEAFKQTVYYKEVLGSILNVQKAMETKIPKKRKGR